MVVMFPICLVFASILVSIVFTSTGDSDRPVMLPEQSRQTVSTGNSSRSVRGSIECVKPISGTSTDSCQDYPRRAAECS